MFDGAWPTILHRVVTECDRWGVGCPHVSPTCNRPGAVHGSDHVGWTSSSTGGPGSQGQCRPGFKAWAHDGSCKSGSPTQRGARKVGCNPHPGVVPVFGSIFLFCDSIEKFFQHTPGAYPKPPTNSLWRNSFHLGIWGSLGYAPRVCWGSLRSMEWLAAGGRLR